MCKITIIDYNIEKTELSRILLLNSFGNDDGFGYYNFKTRKIWKKPKSFTDIIFDLPDEKTYQGFYHVRKASLVNANKKEDKEFREKDTHPFNVNNIIVVHNGTLVFKKLHKDIPDEINNLIDDDDIDSLQYTKVLSSIVGKEKLNATHINKAIKCFTGPLVIVHYDKSEKDKLWIARGKEKTLYMMKILTQEKEVVGVIFNTSFAELYQYIMIHQLQNNNYLYGDITLLEENTIYSYKMGSFELVSEGKVEQSYVYTTTTKWDNNAWEKTGSIVHISGNVRHEIIPLMYENILQAISELNIPLEKVSTLYFLAFGEEIISANLEKLSFFERLLTELIRETNNSKKHLWSKIVSTAGDEKIPYETIQYPYFFNSMKVLKLYLGQLKEVIVQ